MGDDDALVARCLRGERRAYDDLVRKYQAAAFGLAISFVRDRDDAADLVQDAFVKGYLNLENLRDPSRFGPWLRTILVNGAEKRFRTRRERLSLEAVPAELGQRAVEGFGRQNRQRALWDRVRALEEIYRTPLVLFYASGLSYAEIAEFLSVPVSTVRGRLQKARQKLKRKSMEDMAMAPVDVSEQVQNEICKIARSEIHETIDPGTSKHVALFVDLPATVSIVGAEGDKIAVRGHKVAVGKDLEQAQRALDHVKLVHDEVDDWIAEGQHPAERFVGTNTRSENDPHPEAILRRTGGKVPEFNEMYSKFFNHLYVEDVFPHLAPPRELLTRIRQVFPVRARRISLITEKVTDIVLPRAALSEEVREGFQVNWSTEDRAHGPVGRAALELAVPAGISVTVNGADEGTVQGVNGHVLCMNSTFEEISEVRGNVFLLHAYAGRISDLEGDLAQFNHSHPGNRGDAEHATPRSANVQRIGGDLRLDVSYIDFEIRDVSGCVDIRNRAGNTRLEVRNWKEGNRCRIHSVSGDILVRMGKQLMKDRRISGAVLSGSLDYAAMFGIVGPFTQANDSRMRYFSTVKNSHDHYRDADIFICSESGKVAVKHPGC